MSASKHGMHFRRVLLSFAVYASAACCLMTFGTGQAWSQISTDSGPQTPVKVPQVIRIPTNNSDPEKPPIPVEEIIRRFATQEDEMAHASQNYIYRKTVRLTEFGPDGKASGQTEVVTTPAITQDGRRYQRAAPGEQQSTLQLVNLERDALQALTQIPAFPLGSAQLPKYKIVYEGMQPVDELMTYVFRVTPVLLERTRPYFDGLVWVDNHDLVIVKSFGKWVTEMGAQSPPELPFTMYESYRQPVANKYWLPAFAQSDSSVMSKTGNVPVRLVIRWDNYTPAAPAGTGTATPQETPSNTTR